MSEFFQTVFTSIGIADVIDIAIVAFLVYKLMDFIERTGTGTLVKGLLILVAAFFISDLVHLNTLHWILKSLAAVGIIALVVVFQPEIRRALEYFGTRNLMMGRRVTSSRAQEIIKEYIAAILDMSKTRTGALIVIERDVALNDRVNTGTVIDADISAQLIGNIFYKGSPLHDGAVIVRGDRLYAAGCVLPLTEKTSLDKSLGTRHRAAIGITENSDAIAIIVSEETGVISMAENGKIVRYMDAKYLEKVLSDIYSEEESRSSFFSRNKGGDGDDD